MNLTKFLLARIAEDEYQARDCTPGPWVWTEAEAGPNLRADGEIPLMVGRIAFPLDLRHVARHDPARVLAECEAKRRIVYYLMADADGPEPLVRTKQIARFLALPYADHPDYRDEWRPYSR